MTRRTKQGARMRCNIVDEIADVYVAEQKRGRKLSFGDGLDVMARAILNALDSERDYFLKSANRAALDSLTAAMAQALETPSSFVQDRIDLITVLNESRP